MVIQKEVDQQDAEEEVDSQMQLCYITSAEHWVHLLVLFGCLLLNFLQGEDINNA